MSDQPIPTNGANGSANPATGSVVLNLQFTKDLSFEVPGALEIYLSLREPPRTTTAISHPSKNMPSAPSNCGMLPPMAA